MTELRAAQTTMEWIMTAKSVAQLPLGQDYALRCLARAGIVAESASDWVAIAESWKEDFEDPATAGECLGKAESIADVTNEGWYEIAEARAAMGEFSKVVEICKERLEETTWSRIKEIEAKVPLPAGTTALDWIEPGETAKASDGSAEEADDAMENDYVVDGIKNLVDAERFAENTREYIRIAARWRKWFPTLQNAEECMERAEEAVDIPTDRVLLAICWKENFQNIGKAVANMKEAENHAAMGSNSDDWERILQTWERKFQDQDNYLSCAAKWAYSLATDDWYEIENTIRGSFAYNRIIQIQTTLDDLGTLSGHEQKHNIGIWNEEYLSERNPGNYARYYRFTLEQSKKTWIHMTSEDNYSGGEGDPEPDRHSYLIMGEDPAGEVLEEDHRLTWITYPVLPPGTYTLEVNTSKEDRDRLFAVSISIYD